MTAQLNTPKLSVTLVDTDEPIELQAINPDMLNYERTARKHQWAKPTDAPFQWLTFLAWTAARRTGVIDKATTWELFSEELCLEVSAIDAPDIDPTKPVPATG